MKHFYKPFVSVYSDLCMMFENMFPECLSKVGAYDRRASFRVVRSSNLLFTCGT